MDLKHAIIGSFFLILCLIIFFPFIRVAINEWKFNNRKEREAKLERQKELDKLERQKELDKLAKERAIAIKERNERLRIAKDKEVSDNNAKYKSIFSDKYESARIYHEVQYSGAYRIPIADYANYDLNTHGVSFFIDNVKSVKGKGSIEVRYNSFGDDEFDTYNLKIIDGFAVLDKHLKNKNPLHRKVYLTIRENSFEDINTGITHNIVYTPFSILDWK